MKILLIFILIILFEISLSQRCNQKVLEFYGLEGIQHAVKYEDI